MAWLPMPQHARDRADEDHPAEPLALHAARRALGHPERPGEVGVDDLLEPLLGHPDEERVRGDAGVGHQHLDRALVLLDLFERAIDGVVVGDVTLDAEQPLGRPGAAVRDGHLVAVGGQPLRDRQTDPPVSAGDQDRTGYECGLDPAASGGARWLFQSPGQPIASCGVAEICPGSG